ncbi:5-formyltetrahydrofolate cyclo-ligase [Agrobacterium rosae]|uniref:5-formyltetrahydrofolate cyclo-ligase n=1 Tax=Agrobacterium rosae TaxID=1972867 RepID=A0AAE5S0D7_9HYPH|nr:5-formyltetrahydrofolate cyclo-ligase [Agrobacterium rosae]KAA3513093.1 5-formyltetrahydrofolate cyclo-ligase [Agrobacterium rosae]KAA3521418.1 5-formyltetrahydrofolate cyclo-ligase [Agrobacterium rosae]MCM2432725.1 5-formyltetrahydrofolate cyclo-ligase [Agrobacterium rosae]MDX8328204.1 5-formyltetrahydrofolate cyclo-ligase [Agrobacterium rosae]MQB48321.1 5-formyltetrahydrofolate cyclo-ligase [Agrobacterium rosae]
MTSGPLTKAQIRVERLALRDALSVEERQSKSQSITAHGAHGLSFAAGTIVSGFMSIRSEVDLRPLMEALRDKAARICLPVMLDRETIIFREFAKGTELVKSGFGTTGPDESAAVLDPDILLVPLSAFDANGQRIGYGAGHYDRAIARLHAKGLNPALIGIAFDCQEVPSVPAQAHDVALNAVLTESGLRYFNNRTAQ